MQEKNLKNLKSAAPGGADPGRRRLLILGFLVGALVAAVLAWSVAERRDASVSTLPVKGGTDESLRELKAEIHRNLVKAADMLNAEAPRDFGNGVVLVNVTVDNLTMVYRYRMEVEKELLQAASVAMSRPVVERACSVPEMRDYMEYDVVYTYVYQNAAGDPLFDFSVDREVCEKFAKAGMEGNAVSGAATDMKSEPASGSVKSEGRTEKAGGEAAKSEDKAEKAGVESVKSEDKEEKAKPEAAKSEDKEEKAKPEAVKSEGRAEKGKVESSKSEDKAESAKAEDRTEKTEPEAAKSEDRAEEARAEAVKSEDSAEKAGPEAAAAPEKAADTGEGK